MIADLYTKTKVMEKWRDIVAAFYDMYSIGDQLQGAQQRARRGRGQQIWRELLNGQGKSNLTE